MKSRRKYKGNIQNLFEDFGYDKDSKGAEKLNELISNNEKDHPMLINDNTYKQLQRIKKDKKVFSRNAVGISVFMLYEVLYGSSFVIESADEVSKKDKEIEDLKKTIKELKQKDNTQEKVSSNEEINVDEIKKQIKSEILNELSKK